jgi:pimeloyl-ACP methyl ester carboxylesterase
MKELKSKDGTVIAYETAGEGPALVIVDGALTTRSSGSKAQLVRLLAPHATVYTYDRRGRGDSSDTFPYAVEREIEDIAALIDEAGGTASAYGHSSGACLALEAAVKLGHRINKLALYEAPYNDDPAAREAFARYLGELSEALSEGRRGDAVALFMSYVGIPSEQIRGMRNAPIWAGLEAVAPTLAYDHAGIMGQDGSIPTQRVAEVRVPTLVMYGRAGLPFMAETARELQELIPGSQLLGFDGQGHDVSPEVLGPALVEFMTAPTSPK